MNASERNFMTAKRCASDFIRFDIPCLASYFSGNKDEDMKFCSSKWKKELAKTSEELCDQISKASNNRYLAPEFRVPDDVSVRPPLLVFQNCSPKPAVNKLIFTITNRGKQTLDLCCEPPKSEDFQVQTDQITLRRLSPRQSVIVSVKYTQTTDVDQIYVIKFISKIGAFNIPVLVIGPRFLVTCDDSLLIDEAYINMNFSSILPLTNLGPQQLDLIFLTSPPFSIEPSRMIMEPYSFGNVKVTIKSTCVGKQMEKLRIRHGTGEDVFVDLIGLVVVGDITLDRNFVEFPGVYMNTKAIERVVLQSNVHHPVSFSWRRYKTEAEDKAQIDRVHDILNTIYTNADSPVLDVKPDILSQNVMNKETHLLANCNDCFLFDNPFFKIEPLCGTISPMSTFECNIYFHPEQIIAHKLKAYLHIECRMERAELDIQGYVMGPRIDTNISMMDLSVCEYLTKRALTLTFTNNGPIVGTVMYLDDNKSFIICEPTSLCINVTSSKCVDVLLEFIRKGPFLTELKFIIEESGEILTICLKGTVVGLPIRVSCTELNFGVVALGLANTLAFDLFNDGDSHIEYNLVIESDGTQEPLRISEFTKNIRSKFPALPREFSITPAKGVMKARSKVSVEVELIPNKYYERPTEISLLVNGILVEDFSLPITYYCHHPMISCTPFEMDLRYLVINEPCNIHFTMNNDGTAPAAFIISLIGNTMNATFSKTHGILEPGRSMPVQATLTPTELGTGTVVVGVDLFGRSFIEEALWINYTCSAPSLTLNPSELEWNITEHTSSEDLTKEMFIANPFKSPISCTIQVDKPHTHMWHVSPTEATVEFGQVVTMTPILIDLGKSVSSVSVEYSERSQMKLIVYSNITTAIESVPSVLDGYDFGNVLKNERYYKTVKFINHGRKTYTIMSRPREKNIYTNPFTIKPRSFTFKPEEQMEVSLEFYDDKFGPHQTTFDLTVLGKCQKKCPLGTYTVTANVVTKRAALYCEPEVLMLLIDSTNINEARGTIEISTTVSCLDEVECIVDHPYFFIVDDDEVVVERTMFSISPTESKTVIVLFDPYSFSGRRGCFQTKMIIKVDSVGIKKTVEIQGEVNLPHFTWSKNIADFGCLYPFQDGHDEIKLFNGTSETLFVDCQYISIFETRPVQPDENKEEEEFSEWRAPTWSTYSSPYSPSQPGIAVSYNESPSEEVKLKTSRPKPRSAKPEGKSGKKKKGRKEKDEIPPENMKPPSLPPNEDCIKRAQEEIPDVIVPILNDSIEPAIGTPGIIRQLRNPIPLDKFNEYFLISPMSGQVCPGGSITFSVAYLPREPGVTVEAEIRVYRDDGYEETLKLKGVCRETFQYEITPLNVDFGVIPFCEISSRDVSITNQTECPMEIEVINIAEEDARDTRFQRLGTICVKPSVSTIQPYSTGILTVMVHPFVLSSFLKKYRINIHGIQDETLTVQGESSIHFLSLELPPSFHQIPNSEQYNGLRIMYNRIYKQGVEPAKSPSDVCLVSPDDEFDWEIVFEGRIPRVSDVNDGILMGIAEATSEKYCEEYYQHAMVGGGRDPLPHLVLPKQEFDIGGTLIDEENRKTLRIANNCDFDVHYTMSINRSRTVLRTMGFAIEGIDEVNAHFLRKGRVNEHTLIFSPHQISYNLKKKFHIKMGWLLTIKVACGPIMHIHIKTVVTKPHISVPDSIDFGNVRCNEKLFLKMKITNTNLTGCEWSVEIKRSYHENAKRKILRAGALNPFAVEGPDMNGVLPPMLEYELLISFEPPSAGEFLGELRIDVDNNRQSFVTELKGSGECPNIEFTPPKIEFEGAVPYSGHSEKVFTIRNKGSRPVDLYLPECREYFMEQFMLRSVLNYMQKDVCYVPACSASDTPMSYLHEMFAILVQKAEEYFFERGVNPVDEYIFVNEYLHILDEEEPTVPRYDLAAIVCARVAERRKEEKRVSGRVIVCTGAPTIDYIQEANLMATAMQLNIASLDQLFFEEVAWGSKDIAFEIRGLIDSEFHKFMDDDYFINAELAGKDHYQPIIWQMKVEAIHKWEDWMKKPTVLQAKTESAKTAISREDTSRRKFKTDKEGSEKPDVPNLKIPPFSIQKLLTERFEELIHGNGLIIDRLSSEALSNPAAVLSLFLAMTTERDRFDFVDMFTTLEKATARLDLQEEIEKQKEESTKPRFSQICLYEDAKFNALDKPMVDGFFEELKKRYALCHGAQIEPDESPRTKKPKHSGKRKSKISDVKRKRSISANASRKNSSRRSFRSLRSQSSTGGELKEKRIQRMKLMSDFLAYNTQRAEIAHLLRPLGSKGSSISKSQTRSLVEKEQHMNTWIINSEPYEVQSRVHELLESLIACEEFKTPKKLQEHTEEPSGFQERFFRLDRPKFINEIDGEIDGMWFPSLTHTFGIYSAEQYPFCIYPIDPASIFCGISRFSYRRSAWWPDEQTVAQFHLEPGEKVSARVVFQPKDTGTFEKTLRVNIADWPGQATGLVIEGLSDIPHVDLALPTMFPPHCYVFEELSVCPSLTTVEQTTLQMGPALIPKIQGDKKCKVKSHLVFKNISKVTCNISFSLKSPTSTFELEIEEATVKPNQFVTLNINAYPWKVGFKSCIVVVSIKDNPMPIFIEVRVEGYSLNVTLDPPVITIENVLVSQTKKEYFKITNNTWVPVRWKLTETEIIKHPYLKFKQKSGVLKSQESIVSIVTYSPSYVENIELHIDVMICPLLDDKAKFEKGPTMKLQLSSRDVVVDLQTADVRKNQVLIFEDVYVNTEQCKDFVVANMSLFPINYKVSFVSGLNFNPNKIFTITPTEGTLNKQSDLIIEVTAESARPVTFKAQPLLLIEIYDEIEDMFITSIKVNVTYNVCYSKYEIRPLEDISFGNLMVGETRYIDFVIENKGSLPLDYKILTEVAPSESGQGERHHKSPVKQPAKKKKKKSYVRPSLIIEPQKLPRINVTGVLPKKKRPRTSKKGHAKKGQKKKPKSEPAEPIKKVESLKRPVTAVTEIVVKKERPRFTGRNRSSILRQSLRKARALPKSPAPSNLTGEQSHTTKVVAGPFTIDHITNKVDPKETVVLKLIFNPSAESVFEKKFFFKVEYSNTGYGEMDVSGNGVLPSVSYTLTEVLRDALIDLSPENEQKILDEGFPCTTYHEDTHLLELCNFTVGVKAPVKLYFLNDGPVTAEVRLYLTGDDIDCFSTTTDFKNINIPIKTTKPFEFYFTPKTTEVINVMGHIELVMPKGMENRHFLLPMRGRGHIPQIAITRPEDYDRSDNKYYMDMGIAILNRSSVDYFSFKNIGAVAARVLVEFPVTTGVFAFKAKENYREMLKHPSNDPLIDPFAITLTPGMEIDITVEYTAASKILDTCDIHFHVINNPFEKPVIEIFGKGVVKELNMDLPTGFVKDIDAKFHRRKAMSIGNVVSLHEQQAARLSKERFFYELDFGSVPLKKFVKKTFSLSNSSYFTIRVTFTQSKNVWFVPHTFHIGPHSSRDVISLFRSDEDITYYETLGATFESIALTDLHNEVWDNNPKLFQILMDKRGPEIEEEDLKKAEIDEPPYESQSGKNMENKRLDVSVYARAGDPLLTMMTNSIFFPSTRTFEESTAIVFVKNTGNLMGECTFELSGLVKENWNGMVVSGCSMGPYDESVPPPLDTEPTYLVNTSPPGKYSSFIPTRIGYLYAPTPVHLDSETDAKIKGSKSVVSVNSSTPDTQFYNPFHVEPETLSIPPGEVRYTKVVFKPKENCSCQCVLIANFKDTKEVRQEFCKLEGVPLFCPCHIVCVSGKRDFEHPELFSRDGVKIIEIRATSVHGDAMKQFALLNITKEPFEFNFEKLDQMGNQALYFNPLRGRVGGSRKKEIVLHFHPTSPREVKSSWVLNVPLLKIKQRILFVGKVAPPVVKVSPSAITVPVSLTGIFCTKVFEVVNDDDIDYEFHLRPLPLMIGNLECKITPNNGIVPAGASVPFEVKFTSQSSGNVTIQIACKLKNHDSQTLTLIFAEFFELQCMLSLHYDQDQKRKLDPNQSNDINIGFIEPFQPTSATFSLANFGQAPLRYRWVVDDSQKEKQGIKLSFNKTAGVVEQQTTQAVQAIFKLSTNTEFRRYIVQLQVYRGPTYTLSFSGHSRLPYKFSFKRFDFGSCPVLQTGVCNYIKTLLFVNESDQRIVLENKFTNKPHLAVLWTCGTVLPKETVSIMVEFYPLSQEFYHENVRFNINDVTSETIEFDGKGLIIAVRLSDSQKDTVDLRTVPVGHTRTEIKKVVNYSPLAVGCEIEFEEQEGLQISPLSFVVKKNGFQNLSVSYSPTSKCDPFTREVSIHAGGMSNFLFLVKCSSSEISVSFDNNVLLFGRAVKYCPVQMNVNITNDGDIGVNYYWELNNLKTLLTVTPERGYLAPQSTFQSNFSLLSLTKLNINQKVNLVYNGKYREELKIVGEFTEIPDPSETINFNTVVRGTVEHTLELESRTKDRVVLFPVLVGDYFSSPDFVEVLPFHKSQYTVTYAPLTMTTSAVHSGRLFVPYPDGTCVYYALIGEAQPPEPEEIYDWRIPSKTNIIQTFDVHNWLNEFQRFNANVSLDDPQKIQPGMVSIIGEPAVCLPPNGTVSYPVEVMVCKAMTFSFKMFFVNSDTKEYLYYFVKVNCFSLPEAPFVEIQARVHESVSTFVTLSNPFVDPVTFKFHSPAPELTANDVTVQPRSKAEITVDYAPSAIETSKVITCTVTGPPLDDETVTFSLVPLSSLSAPPVKVTAELGSSTTFSVEVHNDAARNTFKKKAVFVAQVHGDDLSLVHDAEFEIAAQGHYSLQLNYEPSEIGNKDYDVEIHSSTDEVLKYYISAIGSPPQPIGPINIDVGSYEIIQFKNVLNSKATFSLTMSEYIFTVSLQRDKEAVPLPGLFTLRSKETALLTIDLKAADVMEHHPINSFPVAEKMQISLVSREGNTIEEKDMIHWVYYLKGFLHVEASKTDGNISEVTEASV